MLTVVEWDTGKGKVEGELALLWAQIWQHWSVVPEKAGIGESPVGGATSHTFLSIFRTVIPMFLDNVDIVWNFEENI